MSTGATITVEDESGTKFYIFRSHDAFPDIVLPDLQATIEKAKGRWDGSEIGQIMAIFMGLTNCPKSRIQDYEIYPEEMDGCYSYQLKYIDGEWVASVR